MPQFKEEIVLKNVMDNDKIRTATVTWITWPNYGSYLQAYALQHVINKIGYNNEIIDDSRIVKAKYYTSLGIFGKLKFLIKRLMGLNEPIGLSDSERDILYKNFKNSFLKINDSFFDLNELSDKYDVFIAGSDQIWFPDDKVYNSFYYLSFTQNKKISYAPSVGVVTYPQKYKSIVKQHIEQFSHISVREGKGKELLSTFVDKDIKVCLDPTLLLTKDEWKEVAASTSISYPYILLYMLSFNEEYLVWAKSYASQKGIKLISISTGVEYEPYVDEIFTAGPSEFISLINNAEEILTDSFHGTVFSILHHKKFITFKRFKDTQSNNQNSRLYNLFRLTGIENRFLSEGELNTFPDFKYLNFDLVDKKLDEEREKSISFLKKSILE